MTKKDRVVKLLNEQNKILNLLVLFFEDGELALQYNEQYKNLQEAFKYNNRLQEEIYVD
jgi:hypothetical protein